MIKLIFWKWDLNHYKIFCPIREIARQIGKWKGCMRHCIYYYHDRVTEDVIVPEELLPKAKRHIRKALKEKEGEN